MSEGVLPVAKVGTREGETFTWHGRGSDFQGLGILQHRLSQRIIQSSCQKGICAESLRRQRQIFKNGANKSSFFRRDKDSREEIGKRIRLILATAARICSNGEPIRDGFRKGALNPSAIFAVA